MEYPVKKLLIVREDKEPELFGEPRPGVAHINYLIDYIEKSYPEDDAIHRFKVSGDPNQIASALNLLKNAIICMNIIDEKTMKYSNSTIVFVPENMSPELQDKFKEITPFLNNFKEIIASTTFLERNREGRLELVDEQIDLDNRLPIEDKMETIIKASCKRGKSK